MGAVKKLKGIQGCFMSQEEMTNSNSKTQGK